MKDKDGNIFIYFTNSEIAEKIGCSVKKAIKLISELKSYGLLLTKRIGLGKPNKIYLKSLERVKETKTSEICKEKASITSNTQNKSPFVQLFNYKKFVDEDENWKSIIKKNIEYEIIIAQKPREKDVIDELIEIMVDTLSSKKSFLRISGEKIPLEKIKKKFLALNSSDIEYILECLNNNTSKIRNIKSYLLSVLLNAKSTINNYYKNQVTYDFRVGRSCLIE